MRRDASGAREPARLDPASAAPTGRRGRGRRVVGRPAGGRRQAVRAQVGDRARRVRDHGEQRAESRGDRCITCTSDAYPAGLQRDGQAIEPRRVPSAQRRSVEPGGAAALHRWSVRHGGRGVGRASTSGRGNGDGPGETGDDRQRDGRREAGAPREHMPGVWPRRWSVPRVGRHEGLYPSGRRKVPGAPAPLTRQARQRRMITRSHRRRPAHRPADASS